VFTGVKQTWRDYNAKAEQRCSIKRHDPPVNIVGGYRFPGAPVIDMNPPDVKPVSARLPALHPKTDAAKSMASRLIDDSLDIPDFLRRTHPPQRLAA
jgi:hypothetical protein